MVPVRISAARSWVAGRSTRSDRHVPPGAIGDSTACSRTRELSGRPGRSAGRRPRAARRPAGGRRDSARRCASRRTASSSANRTELRRNPLPSSTHTASGAGDQNIGGALRAQQRVENAGAGEFGLQHPQAAQHLGVAEHPTGLRPDRRRDRRSAAAARIRPPAARGPGRSATRSCRVHHRMLLQNRQHPPSGDSERETGAATEDRRVRALPPCRPAAASPPAAEGRRSRPRPTDRRPPGAGPRTTTPAFGFTVDTQRATPSAAAQERTSAGAMTTTRSADSRAVSAAAVDRRGTSQTTVAPPRLPASITAPSGAASMSPPPRPPESTLMPRWRGSASRSAV